MLLRKLRINYVESKDIIYQNVYDQLSKLERTWKRFGDSARIPSYEEVKSVVDSMIELVRDSPESISVESGGILVKRTDDYIDVYVHAGGFK